MIVSLSCQVSKEDEGKQVDSSCHRLTASFVRHRHKSDSSVPVCLFYEVGYPMSMALVSVDGMSVSTTDRSLMSEEEDKRYLLESMTWCETTRANPDVLMHRQSSVCLSLICVYPDDSPPVLLPAE